LAASGADVVEQDLPEAAAREVPANIRVPGGKYRLVSEWEAGTPANHLTGRSALEESASGGKAWEARPTADAANKHLIFGPYLEVPTGAYAAFFRLRLLDVVDDDICAQLDACVVEAVKVLAVKDVWAGDLARDRYVRVPLFFRSPGGKLECRLFWNGYAGLRLDKVELYAVDGLTPADFAPRAPSAAPSGRPDGLAYAPPDRPFHEILPRSLAPEPRLTVIDLAREPYDRRMLLLCLQGLVNRGRPSMYAILDKTDRQWLDWMKTRGWVESEESIDAPMTLLARYRDKIKGLVIYDPRLAASKNAAMMVASVKDGLAASPRLARELGLPVLDDLRGRWQTNAEALRWAAEELWPRLNHFVLACLYPEDASGLRDYLYQHRIFTFWITGPIDGALPGGDPTAEARVMEDVLAKAPANIPVLGFPWAGDDVGIGEGSGVRLFAQYGKFLVGSVGVGNLSVHAGYPAPAFTQRLFPTPELRADTVYLTWLMSDGDNLPVLSRGNFPQLWADPARGRVPVAWSLSLCAALMVPAVVDWYYAHATANDAFVGAVSGVGYTYPDDYAQRFDAASQVRAFGDFLDLTRRYLPLADLRQIWIMGASRPEVISRYAAEIPEIDAVFPDYGKRLDRYDEAFYPVTRGVPVFHAVTHWEERATRERKIDLLLSQIRAATPDECPAFLHAFIWNWNADLSILPEVMSRLGSEYVAVGPSQLAALAKQSLVQARVRLRCAPAVAAIEGREVLFRVTAYNATASALPYQAYCGGGGDLSRAPERGTIAPFESAEIAFCGKPEGVSLTVGVRGPWGSRAKVVRLRVIPAGEMAGALPEGVSLRFADRFEAAGLSHRSGDRQQDATSSCGSVWVARTGDAEAGHIVYGPYKPFPAGRYLAVFRLKRIGDGEGMFARIDARADGVREDLSSRAIETKVMPLNVWRSVPLLFDQPGGLLETRVFWPGQAPLAAGEILLWEVE